MSGDYEVRKRLLEIDPPDISLIAAYPGLGDAWAKRANVKPRDLAKGQQRARLGLKTALTRDTSGFAVELAKFWDVRIAPRLGFMTDEPDRTLHGVRIASALIGRTGARALVSCLASAGFEVSAEVAERFDELTSAADIPLTDEEMETLTSVVKGHRIAQRSHPGDSLPAESAVIAADAPSQLNSNGVQGLIAGLRDQAARLVETLATAADDIREGQPVSHVQDELQAWNDRLSDTWSAVGGTKSSESISFAAMENLHAQIVERESAAATAEQARIEMVARLEQLRQLVASLEPLKADEQFLASYEQASAEIAALEKALGLAASDETADDHSKHSRYQHPVAATAQVITASQESAVESEHAESVHDVDEQLAAANENNAPPSNEPHPCIDERWSVEQTTPETLTAEVSPTEESNSVVDSYSGEDSSPVESVSSIQAQDPQAADVVQVPDDYEPSAIRSAPNDYARDLTNHVASHHFGAAWLVAAAAGLPEHEVNTYRLAAAAFYSAPGGIDPAEVLVRLTTNLSGNKSYSCQSARVALAATLRATLAAGWSPRSELEAVAAQANLDGSGRELVAAAIAASDRNYQHLQDLGTDVVHASGDVHEQALSIRAELEGMRIKFARADKVLKYLLRGTEPIGAALDAVLADTTGNDRREALTAALSMLESPDAVIAAADAVVSTSQQRRKPIESHARVRLQRAVDLTASCVAQSLNSAVVVATDSQTAVVQEVRNDLIAAARAALPTFAQAEEPGDAALAVLTDWILTPGSPGRGSNELQLLLDESLPATSAERDRDGLPIVDSDCAADVVLELRTPADWDSLFATYVARGDLQEAENAGRHAPHLLDQMSTIRTDWKRRLDREVSAIRADLARTYADGATHGSNTDSSQFEAEAQLVAPGEYRGDRFDVQMADLRRLRDVLAQHRARTAEYLCDRVQDEIRSATDRTRILALIDDEDFVGANELLALARGGELPALNDDTTAMNAHFFDEFVDSLSAVDLSSAPSVNDLLTIFSEGQLDEVSDTDRARLEGWPNLGSRRGGKNLNDKLFAVLRALGLDTRGVPSRQTSPGVRHFDVFRVDASPVDGSLVPGLGSQATHYMVAVTSDDKLLRETLTAAFPAKNGPNIVLFDGVLTMDQRRQCLNACRDKKINAIVVDHAVAAFVASRRPRSFRAVQQLTLPFTCFSHYTVVSGNVPDEVFVGRNDELEQLADQRGSLFVYGGRQLGKSALLRKIQRDFNSIPDHHAIFIDLNSHGIGTWADPQQLWQVLHNELAKFGSMGIRANSAVRNPDVVIKAMSQWLEDKESRRLLLLLDEADAFLEKESQEAPNGFRNIGPLKGLFDNTAGRFKPVFAGLHKVQRLQNIANTPLAHGGRDVLIGPLSAKPARDLVVKPLEALGYRFGNPEAVWRLLAFTNLQPGLIQVVCNDLVAHLQSRPLLKGEPLVSIKDSDVDFVTAHETTRSKIAEKLRLTIMLEDRYRVIALAVAIMSMEDNFREKYAAADIREHCEMYWPQGFEDLNSAEFRVYLDEVVGLGVLTTDDEKLFAVRSPNIVTMLGTKDQLITELDENRDQFDLPPHYNPRSTRRQFISDEGPARSPLSEHDLSELIPVRKKYPPRDFLIAGGELLGINNVAPILTHVGAQRGIQVTVFDASQPNLESSLSDFSWVGSGTSAPRVAVVDGTQIDARQMDAILRSADAVRKRSHGHLIIVLGPDGCRAMEELRQHWSDTHTSLITLEKLSGDGIRSRHDNPFNTPTDRHDLLRYSGGWPELVEQAVVEVSNRNVSYAEEWERLTQFPRNSVEANTFLRRLGVSERELELLTAWVQLGSTSYEGAGDIAAVLERDVSEVLSAASLFTLLGAVNEHQGDFQIDPVVARAVNSIA